MLQGEAESHEVETQTLMFFKKSLQLALML